MVETDKPLQRKQSVKDLISNPNAPPLTARWFHAVDAPTVDPVSIRRQKTLSRTDSMKSTTTASTTTTTTTSTTTSSSTSSTSKNKVQPKNWIPFSKRDSKAIEEAYQDELDTTVPVNEDYLFEVDINKRAIDPIYWEGPTFEIRRATWFTQGDGSKWVPVEENLAEQIEIGYQERKPYTILESSENENNNNKNTTESAKEESKLKTELEKQPVEKQWNLLGSYLGQYVVYTGKSSAWLLYDTAGSKIAQSIITKLTNNQNLGGQRLIRGYDEVEKQGKEKAASTTTNNNEKVTSTSDNDIDKNEMVERTIKEEKEGNEQKKETINKKLAEQQAEDFNNTNNPNGDDCEGERRQINHVIFAVHGIGQKMTERFGLTFVHDINVLRKTMKQCYLEALPSSFRKKHNNSNGIQVLPILWRKDISFGMANDSENNSSETDIGMRCTTDDGCPTLEEITLDGAPMYRTLVSDVFLDIPLYMTQKYREQMTIVITNEINRVYNLFIERHPEFLKNNGKVSILGHSLGSLLAFDILSTQPMTSLETSLAKSKDKLPLPTEKKIPSLSFKVDNFFAVGSPLGLFLLLRGFKISSRKALAQGSITDWNETSANMLNDHHHQHHHHQHSIPYYYPAVENLYNIFHRSDPVAYRLEPLISRYYGIKEKPVSIPYIKGGLKGVLDAGFNVGTDIANRANAMFDSFRSSWTNSIIMRGFGLTKVEQNSNNNNNNNNGENNGDSDGSEINMETMKKMDPKSSGAKKLALLNPKAKRVDFCLQEGILENAYVSALSVHMNYWADLDVAAMLIREVYKNTSDAPN
ncbi:unnamed protein product [Cunninghamella blakesleeana]